MMNQPCVSRLGIWTVYVYSDEQCYFFCTTQLCSRTIVPKVKKRSPYSTGSLSALHDFQQTKNWPSSFPSSFPTMKLLAASLINAN